MNIPEDMRAGVLHTVRDGELEVVEYNGCLDVEVKFIDTGYSVSCRADAIRSGSVKDKLKPVIFGVGYIGNGRYKALDKNRKRTEHYERWYHMLERCYCRKHQKRYPTYAGCSVVAEWHNFQNFAEWCDTVRPDGDGFEIDKDGLVHGNKIYSPSTCQLISKRKNIEISHAKQFNLISPEGERVTVFNLTKFCREMGLSVKNLHMVTQGKRKSHKGWMANEE